MMHADIVQDYEKACRSLQPKGAPTKETVTDDSISRVYPIELRAGILRVAAEVEVYVQDWPNGYEIGLILRCDDYVLGRYADGVWLLPLGEAS